MSAASNLRSEDQFLCSICLDLFTNPVSTPCGHNFCTTCITQHWDSNVLYNCPLCKEQFSSRPQLRVNTFIREMVDQFRHEAQQAAEPAEVLCDVCTGTKQMALKSCMVCLASYCQTHLEPHLTTSRLKRHQLVDPVENLEDRMCLKHDKPLELFCKTDQTCVCSLCPVLDHKTHEFFPLREEYEAEKAELMKTDDEVQQMIQNRQLKIQEIKGSLKISKAESIRVVTNLMDSLERNKKSFMKEMEDQQKTTEKQAEDFIKGLEQEISELMKRSSELKQISRSEDHLHLLQNFKSLKPAPTTKDWTEVRLDLPSFRDHSDVVKFMTQLVEDILENIGKSEAELKRAQQFEVDLTLDPESAHPKLILSDDRKQVHHSDVRKELPNNPERFTDCPCVLGTQSFTSGRFYFQVQVKEKNQWILGVARKSINRKGPITASPQKGFWAVGLRNKNKYKALTDPPVTLSLQSVPDMVGVFVDYQEGLVTFYDVDAATLIYSFAGCWFTEELYPYFSPFPNNGRKNSSPLIICPVNRSS